MTNPYSPRRRRTLAGLEHLDDSGLSVQTAAELPVARLRRLGADDDQVTYYTEVWASMGVDERSSWARSLSVLTDDELRKDIAETRAGEVKGESRHEGGGYYSLWVDGVQVTDENIRGRDEAERTLAQVMSGRG